MNDKNHNSAFLGTNSFEQSESLCRGVLDPEAEFDIEELGPATRSIGVSSGPTPVQTLPSHYNRHQGAYLYRDGVGTGGNDGDGDKHVECTPPLTIPFMPQKQHQRADDLLSSKLRSNDAVDMIPAKLVAPNLPFETSLFPLERCHYYTNKPTPELFSDIQVALKEKAVVFKFVPGKFKFSCEYRTGVNNVRFVCRAYFVPEDGRTVVEFQRRSGCCIVCAKVVDAVRSTLLARECNSEALPISIRPFKPKPLAASACLVQEEGESSAKVERARQEAQQCKLMRDLQDCLAQGRDDVLTDFAKVLIPLSQLAPEHLLGQPSHAELLAALGRHEIQSTRLSALLCLANLAAACFPQSGEGLSSVPFLRRGVSTDTEDDNPDVETGEEPAPSAGDVCAWFEDVLETIINALQSKFGPRSDAHVRREAARALWHLSKESFARTAAARQVLESCVSGDAEEDHVLQEYVRGALEHMQFC